MARFAYIQKKKPEHICIYQLHSGSVMYSSELLKENHISTCLKQNIEIWLRQTLQFDPNLRRSSNIFDNLLTILDKKIVNVFSVHTLEFYSYEINECSLISTLKDWIARDTKVQKSDQVLLSNLGVFDIRDDRYVIDFLLKDDFNFFVFKKGAFINRETFKLPKYVSILFENCTTLYKWRELRIIYIKALFFLRQEHKMLNSLITGFDLCVQFINYLNLRLKDSLIQLNKTLTTLLIKIDCYYNLHNNDVKLDSCDVYKQLLVRFLELMADLKKIIHSHNQFIRKVDDLYKRQVLLNKARLSVTPVIKKCDLSNAITKATDLIAKGAKDLITPIEMVRVVSNALKEKDKLLNNNNFQNYSKAMLVAIKDVEILQNAIDVFHNSVKDLSKAIDNNQKEQYKILLLSRKPKRKVSLVDSNHVVWDTETLLNENQEIRFQFEEALGEMLVEQKQFREELQLCLSEKF